MYIWKVSLLCEFSHAHSSGACACIFCHTYHKQTVCCPYGSSGGWQIHCVICTTWNSAYTGNSQTRPLIYVYACQCYHQAVAMNAVILPIQILLLATYSHQLKIQNSNYLNTGLFSVLVAVSLTHHRNYICIIATI